MVEISNVKIVTGYKGGCGKTITSLALMIHAIRNNNKVLVVDCNANNQDLMATITNLYHDDYQVMENYKRWEFSVDGTKKQLIAIKPKERKWNSIDIWHFLWEVIEAERNNASVMIVDSHPSIAHLALDVHTMNTADLFNPEIEKNYRLETYFIWNLSAPDKTEDLKEICESIKIMERDTPSYKSHNQIHIFNPHEAKSPRTFFNHSLRRKWNKNQKRKKAFGISIETLIGLIKEINIEFDYKTEISPSKIFEVWNNFFTELLNKRNNKAILNVLPIFKYFDLSNFTTGQIYSKNRNIRGIQEDMGGFYSFIHAFESMRDKFLK